MPPRIIQNFGLFWERPQIEWGRPGPGGAGHLRGYATSPATTVDFREQRGIYVLYEGDSIAAQRVVYIGQAGAHQQDLFHRLRNHRDEADLFSRVAHAWRAKRVGKRIEQRFRKTLQGLVKRETVLKEGPFVVLPDTKVYPRSRAETGIPAERIAPAEYRAAVLAVLSNGPCPKRDVFAKARRLLGFDRTGSTLEEQLARAVDVLLARADWVVGVGACVERRPSARFD